MEDDNAWNYENTTEQPSELVPVTWTASEFVHHEKPSGWYGAMLAVGVFLAIAVFFLTGRGLSGLFASFVIILSVIAMLIVGKRQPRVLNYTIDDGGITVEDKFYDFGIFKSFSIAAPLTLYFADEDADKIIDMLGEFLPHEERKNDTVDRLMSKIRF
jgi:hypothetical protein